ncbi:hypothetical protein WMY93_000970 [Mugilogobius chulae]|uniref:HTH La-type RNA-binding domain-containing protein n=1 Tax=Mugilogobius chulae TaxID=88201 RepID=A0AAW0Q410_9GOBI
MIRWTERAQGLVSEENHDGERLLLHIRAQLEELFSDSNLAEDGFLLKHIQKNKEGFVSLKLLTCLRKIKVLTDNWYMTLAASLLSALLEVNAESTKVRRVLPYPDWLLSSPTSKLLLLWNLPADWITPTAGTSENNPALPPHILHKLSSYGPVTSHWLLSPGEDLPKELKCYARRQKELGQCLCAVVKYGSLSAIRKAYGDLKGAEMVSADVGLRVVTLGFRSAYLISNEQPNKNRGDPGTPIEEAAITIQKKTSQKYGRFCSDGRWSGPDWESEDGQVCTVCGNAMAAQEKTGSGGQKNAPKQSASNPPAKRTGRHQRLSRQKKL